jgi:hypothetical protein
MKGEGPLDSERMAYLPAVVCSNEQTIFGNNENLRSSTNSVLEQADHRKSVTRRQKSSACLQSPDGTHFVSRDQRQNGDMGS